MSTLATLRFTLGVAVAVATPTAASAQASHAPSRPAKHVDTLPDITNKLVAVYGDHPLTDSAIAVLRRWGLRVTDHSSTVVAQAQRERRRLDAASIAVLVEVRPDSMVGGPILVATLLDVMTLRRLRLASALLPAKGPWGSAMTTALTQLLERGERR